MTVTVNSALGSDSIAEGAKAFGCAAVTTLRVDVIVPCYNYGRFLGDCVRSVLAQPGCEVRILIIDDASTDDSRAVARALAAEDPRVQVRAHDINRGHIATYNEGLDWVSGDYVLLLSSDDILAPGAFERAIGLMEENRNVGFVYGRSMRFAETAETVAAAAGQPSDVPPGFVEPGVEFIRKFCASPVNTVESATAVVRASFQKQVGGYRPELPHSGDMEMWLRLAAHADVGVVPGVQAFTRIHAKNMHLSYKANRDIEDFRQRRIVFRTFFAADGRSLRERRALEASAWRALAEELLWAAVRAFDEAAPPDLVAQFIGEARDICPAITKTRLWWKVRTRRFIGSRLWRAMSGMRDPALAINEAGPAALDRRLPRSSVAAPSGETSGSPSGAV
jgi:glycosyltransferase involved in cell wall biosynthesis